MVVTKGAFLTLVAAHAGDPEEGDVPEDERVAPPAAGRQPPFWAVKRPARAHTEAPQYNTAPIHHGERPPTSWWARARSHYRFAPPPTHSLPYSLR